MIINKSDYENIITYCVEHVGNEKYDAIMHAGGDIKLLIASDAIEDVAYSNIFIHAKRSGNRDGFIIKGFTQDAYYVYDDKSKEFTRV